MPRRLLAVTLAFLAMPAVPGRAGAQALRPPDRAAAARPPVPGATAGVTAFVEVNVVPMDTERVLERQTVTT